MLHNLNSQDQKKYKEVVKLYLELLDERDVEFSLEGGGEEELVEDDKIILKSSGEILAELRETTSKSKKRGVQSEFNDIGYGLGKRRRGESSYLLRNVFRLMSSSFLSPLSSFLNKFFALLEDEEERNNNSPPPPSSEPTTTTTITRFKFSESVCKELVRDTMSQYSSFLSSLKAYCRQSPSHPIVQDISHILQSICLSKGGSSTPLLGVVFHLGVLFFSLKTFSHLSSSTISSLSSQYLSHLSLTLDMEEEDDEKTGQILHFTALLEKQFVLVNFLVAFDEGLVPLNEEEQEMSFDEKASLFSSPDFNLFQEISWK